MPDQPYDPANPYTNVNPPQGEPVPPPYTPPAGEYQQPGYNNTYAPPPPYGQPYGAPQAAGLSSNVAAGLSYLTFIPAILFLVLEPYRRDPLVRFNAWQEIALTIVGFAINLFFHFFGPVGSLVAGVLGLVLFVFWIIAIIKAFSGSTFKIPLVGDLAQTLARQ